jgi:hypothetical protein
MSHLIPKKKIKEGSKYKIEILSELPHQQRVIINELGIKVDV